VTHLSRSQILVYGAVAVALLLLGARWIRESNAEGAPPGEVSFTVPSGGVAGGGGQDVVVHVAGAVREPGVYRLPAGSRVTDAVERAGGTTGAAATDAINLAATLGDGQQIVVPGRGPAPAGSAGAASAGAASTAEGPISLGTATVEELDTIEGIGPVTAQEIVDFRDQQGGLSSIEELDEISGIGPATMESLRASLQP
jgi:competence protein ComEA